MRGLDRRGWVLLLLILVVVAQSDYAVATNVPLNECYAGCEKQEAKADVLCLLSLAAGPPAFTLCVLGARAAFWYCAIECYVAHATGAPPTPITPEPYYDLRTDEAMVISFQLFDMTGMALEGPGTVVGVEMSALAMAELDTMIPLAENPFITLGNAAYDSTSNAWVFAWTRGEGDPTAAVPDSLGFLVRACFTDAVEDTIYPGYALISPPPPVTDVPAALSPEDLLVKNYPNPFNPRTMISFGLPETGAVYLDIFDVTGRQVRRLIDGEVYSAGQHEAAWDGRDTQGRQAAAGIYFCRLRAGDFSSTTRMALIK